MLTWYTPQKAVIQALMIKQVIQKNERDKECLGKTKLFQYIVNENHKVYPNINKKPITKLHVH